MTINFQNNTYHKEIKIICDGREYIINKGAVQTVFTNSNHIRLVVLVSDKNRVILNWIFILLDGFIDGDSVVNMLKCNAEYDLYFPENCVCETISIEGLEVRDTDQCTYDSVYLQNNNLVITRYRYFLKEWKKQKRKAMFYHIVVTSALPVLLFLLGWFFSRGDVWALVVAVLNLSVFSIPSWIRATRLKRFYSDDNAQELLIMEDMMRRRNNGNPVINEPTDFIGKKIYKILDKFFGNKN